MRNSKGTGRLTSWNWAVALGTIMSMIALSWDSLDKSPVMRNRFSSKFSITKILFRHIDDFTILDNIVKWFPSIVCFSQQVLKSEIAFQFGQTLISFDFFGPSEYSSQPKRQNHPNCARSIIRLEFSESDENVQTDSTHQIERKPNFLFGRIEMDILKKRPQNLDSQSISRLRRLNKNKFFEALKEERTHDPRSTSRKSQRIVLKARL
jgi:hypothetical protein